VYQPGGTATDRTIPQLYPDHNREGKDAADSASATRSLRGPCQPAQLTAQRRAGATASPGPPAVPEDWTPWNCRACSAGQHSDRSKSAKGATILAPLAL